jgi:hypothetical protein
MATERDLERFLCTLDRQTEKNDKEGKEGEAGGKHETKKVLLLPLSPSVRPDKQTNKHPCA